ncbi:MAG: S-methyl-5-thioribose-1-phosphate isomerase [Methanoregulaceae archaeon]
MQDQKTLFWDEENGSIVFIDQTLLPTKFKTVTCTTIPRLVRAISRLEIRGAPALGVAGAFGVALAAVRSRKKEFPAFIGDVQRDARTIRETRPTAINLAWGVDRVLSVIKMGTTPGEVRTLAIAEAQKVAREDGEICRTLGKTGAKLIPDKATILTHCNAGALACSEWGTALGVIRSARDAGKEVRVIACETRPLLQGARLTAWELARDGIDVTVITDSAAGFLMRKGRIDCAIVGADRITRDAVFNKIGTYTHAVTCRHHGIPFYVAAPLSTFDPTLSENEVTIEERNRDEIATCGSRTTVPENASVLNYAFDATPLDLVTAIMTEKGVHRPPLDLTMLLGSR